MVLVALHLQDDLISWGPGRTLAAKDHYVEYILAKDVGSITKGSLAGSSLCQQRSSTGQKTQSRTTRDALYQNQPCHGVAR